MRWKLEAQHSASVDSLPLPETDGREAAKVKKAGLDSSLITVIIRFF
jgi:hypothetical protein